MFRNGLCYDVTMLHCYTLVKIFQQSLLKALPFAFFEKPFTFFKKLFIFFRWANELIRDKRKSIDNRWLSMLLISSGYQDSNLGPPAPKAGALTGLRYIPNDFWIALFFKSDAKVRLYFISANFLDVFYKKKWIRESPYPLLCLYFLII